MGIEDMTAPLIDPFKNALGPLQNLIEGHRTNHQDMMNLVNSLVAAAGSSGGGLGDLFSGLTATAVQDATQKLVQMSEQRMQALDKMVSGFDSAANQALNAVDGVLGAALDGGLLDKVLSHFDIVGVIMNGQGIVQDAINALLQTFLDELSNPFSLLVDIAEGAIEMLTGIFPATLLPWGAEVFEVAQEVIQVINMIETLLSALQSLSTPVQELFSQIGQQAAPTFDGDLQKLQQLEQIMMGVIQANTKSLATVGQSAGGQAVSTLNQGFGTGPNQIGSTPTPLPGLGNTMNQYAQIIVNTPQGKETVLVPITSQPVQVAIGGAPTPGGATAGGQITITISGAQPGAMTGAGAVPPVGGIPGAATINPGVASSLNPQPLPPSPPPNLGAPTRVPLSDSGFSGGYGGGGGFRAPASIPPSLPLGTGGYNGNLHTLGTTMLSTHLPAHGTVMVGGAYGKSGAIGITAAGGLNAGGAARMSATQGVRSDGSGGMFAMPPMAMGGLYGGGTTASDDDDK